MYKVSVMLMSALLNVSNTIIDYLNLPLFVLLIHLRTKTATATAAVTTTRTVIPIIMKLPTVLYLSSHFCTWLPEKR